MILDSSSSQKANNTHTSEPTGTPQEPPHEQPTQVMHTLIQSLLGVILVAVESFMTLMLRFDGTLRQVVYPLAKDNVVVCVRSYVPHLTFYVTFSYNGVLLDTELQGNQQVDVTINAFTWQLFAAVFANNPQQVDKLQMRGESGRVEQVKQFLVTIGVGQIIQYVIKAVKGKTSQKSDEEKETKQEKIARYKTQISEQQAKIHTLTLSQTQLNTQVLELQSKNKTLMIALGVAVVALIGCMIVLLIQ